MLYNVNVICFLFYSTTLCTNGVLLGCSGGDLTAKHGPITTTSNEEIRAVFTDPYLPLSGDDSGNNPSYFTLYSLVCVCLFFHLWQLCMFLA